MNTEFYRLIGSLHAVIHFIRSQEHKVREGTHGALPPPAPVPATGSASPDPTGAPEPESKPIAEERIKVEERLRELEKVVSDLLSEQAKISHAFFDFRRMMSKNAEGFYHAINFLRRKAPEWQVMDEELLRLIEYYQGTASEMFFGGDGYGGNPGSSSSGRP